MIINITAKNTTVTEGIRTYVEKRFVKFNKYAPEDTVVHTKIEVKEGGDRHKVEVTIVIGKQTLRAEANDVNMYTAIDIVEKKMSGLLKKRKEKLMDRRQQAPDIPVQADEPIADEYVITRTKYHTLVPMTAQDACEAMEMISHPFYVYIDSELDKMCAVYMRADGTYGQLIYN